MGMLVSCMLSVQVVNSFESHRRTHSLGLVRLLVLETSPGVFTTRLRLVMPAISRRSSMEDRYRGLPQHRSILKVVGIRACLWPLPKVVESSSLILMGQATAMLLLLITCSIRMAMA